MADKKQTPTMPPVQNHSHEMPEMSKKMQGMMDSKTKEIMNSHMGKK